MAGALAERVFVEKIKGVGFAEPEIHQRRRFSIDDAARYPLFTPDLIARMRQLLTPELQDEVAISVTLTARKPVPAQ